MQEIYIYGCGGVGCELAESFFASDHYRLMGFIDDNPGIRECMGIPSKTLDEMLAERKPEELHVVISFGEPAVRKMVSEKVKRAGLRELTVDLSSHFSPRFSSAEAGTILHSFSYVSVNAHIGQCCLINKYVLVGHDCRVGDYCVLSPKVILGGDVKLGDNTFIGAGAVLRNGVTIGKNVIIGMGAAVLHDVEDDAVVAGNPAKFIRKNESKMVFCR